jgi:tetratricopeptide (TPR) repeat protein
VRLTPIDDPQAFGARLRSVRLRAGMSLRELQFPGCTASYISRIESGDRVPSLQVINALAERLRVSPATLLGRPEAARADDMLVDAELALRLGDVDVARETYSRLIEDGIVEVRARALAGLGQIAAAEGDGGQATELLEEAHGLLGSRFLAQLSAVQTLGLLYADASRFEEAIVLFRGGRDAALARGDRPAALRMLLLIANSFIDLGALPESTRELADALGEAETLGDLDLRARTLWSQSRLHTIEGRHDLAASFARRALATLEVAQDDLSIARARQLLAYIELERGRPDEALGLIEAALPIVERSGAATERATLRLEQARALVMLGDSEAAREIALEVSPVRVASARVDTGRLFITLGDIWSALAEPGSAEEMYDAAIAALSGHRNPHLARAYRQKASLLEARGDHAAALALLKHAVDAASVQPVPARIR